MNKKPLYNIPVTYGPVGDSFTKGKITEVLPEHM